jgi:hypothetical protein
LEILREKLKSTIVGAQDQVINTNNFKNKILKEETDNVNNTKELLTT